MIRWSDKPPSDQRILAGPPAFATVGEPNVVLFFLALPTPLGIPHRSIIPAWGQRYFDPKEGPGALVSKDRHGNEIYIKGSFQFFQEEHFLTPKSAAAARSLQMETFERLDPTEFEKLSPYQDPIYGVTRVTVVEAAWTVKDGETETLQTALDEVLEALVTVQKGHDLLAGRLVSRISRGRLDPFVPYIYRPFGLPPQPGEIPANNGGKYRSLTQVEDLAKFDIERLIQDSENLAADVFDAFAMLRQEAVAAVSDGNYAAAAVFAGAAVETLLTEILQLLEWEKGTSPEQTAKRLPWNGGPNKPFFQRLQELLGGDWTPDSPQLRDWEKKTKDLRNRSAHSGYTPNAAEIHDSIDALEGIERYVGARLTTEAGTFPMAAEFFVSPPLLQERGVAETWRKAIQSKLRPPHGRQRFSRFKREVQRNKPKGDGPRVGRPEDSRIYRVDSEESTTYFLVDEEYGLARKATVAAHPSEAAIRQALRTKPPEIPVLVTAYNDPPEFRVSGPWILAGDVIPTLGWRAQPIEGFDVPHSKDG